MRGSEGRLPVRSAAGARSHDQAAARSSCRIGRRATAVIAEVAGISPELADSGMSLEELRMLDAMLQVSTQRRKIEQRLYVPLAEHEAVIADVFTTMQAEVLSTVGRLDPSGKWPAAVGTR
jgi:hypothetical protein